MTKKTRTKLSGAMLLGIGALLLSACGHGQEESQSPGALLEHKRKVDRRVDRVLDRLNATPEQRRQVHRIKASLIKQALPLRQSRDQLHDRLRAEWASNNPDRRGIHQEVDRHLQQMRSLVHVALDRAIDLHGVLTAEQRAELLRLIDQLRQMHRMWKGD
jgi:protein CpxP